MKKILIVLLLVAVLFIGGCTSGGTGETVAKETGSDPRVTTTICTPDWGCSGWGECMKQGYKTRTCEDKNSCGTDRNKPETTESCTYVYKKGETISLEGMEYTMTKAYTTPYIGSGYFVSRADGIYTVLCFNVKNIGKKANTVYSSDFKLFDLQEREFEDTYVLGLENQIMILEELNPGIDKDMCLVYDVPKDAKDMYCEVSPSFWGKSKYFWVGSVAE